ncbi:S41 family peptidase [Allofustis seminis]|uniref:S41 family peptidase n=1 Tax=Allofustis seminis TaxID=166939 RepID=UPI00037B77BE|nr:S41 family peptidase [Allofustis seminis]
MSSSKKQWNKKVTLKQYIISIVGAVVLAIVGTSLYKDYQLKANNEVWMSTIHTEKELAPLEEMYKLLLTRYVDSVDKQKLIDGALTGMAQSAGDPYTEYLSEDFAKSLTEDISGSFQGIGTEVTMEGQYIKVIAPLSDSPAERAGIQANDYILSVDGTSLTGMQLSEAVDLIRGEEGSTVTLTILRGQQQFDVELTRAKIPVETVKVEIKEEHPDIAHIRLTKFSEPTAKELIEALKKLENQGIQSIVLDVRNNPGGVLIGALQVANVFVPDGKPIMQSTDRTQKAPTIYYAEKALGTYKFKGNVVLLVDGGSASASEILAGALQSINIPLIGQKTFGKGTIQTIQPLQYSKGELKITMGRWLTATGEPINEKGIMPDIEVASDVPDAMFAINTEKTYEIDDIGPEVENIKTILKYLGYDVNQTNVFDEKTQESVRDFQQQHEIEVTGKVQAETAGALSTAVRERMIADDKQYQAAIDTLLNERNN